MPQDFWIMRPFNLLFFLSFAGFLLLLMIASLLLRNKSEKVRDIVLIAACTVTLIGFIFYKIFLSLDADFNIIISISRSSV